MTKILVALVLMVLLTIVIVPVTTAPANAWEIPGICSVMGQNPGLVSECIIMFVFQNWNPLDWD